MPVANPKDFKDLKLDVFIQELVPSKPFKKRLGVIQHHFIAV